jgi:hypothetical protein
MGRKYRHQQLWRRIRVELEAVDAFEYGRRRGLLERRSGALHGSELLSFAVDAAIGGAFARGNVQSVGRWDLMRWTRALGWSGVAVFIVSLVVALTLWSGWSLIGSVTCRPHERRLRRRDIEVEIERVGRHLMGVTRRYGETREAVVRGNKQCK